MSEADLMQQIKSRLNLWQMTGDVVWWTRLQSGSINLGQRWVRLAEKGTPDFVAVIRNKQQNIAVLFIEAKSLKGKLTLEQKEFNHKYNKYKDVFVATVDHIDCLKSIVNTLAYDRLQDIKI